jgi:hypothetical protein
MCVLADKRGIACHYPDHVVRIAALEQAWQAKKAMAPRSGPAIGWELGKVTLAWRPAWNRGVIAPLPEAAGLCEGICTAGPAKLVALFALKFASHLFGENQYGSRVICQHNQVLFANPLGLRIPPFWLPSP